MKIETLIKERKKARVEYLDCKDTNQATKKLVEFTKIDNKISQKQEKFISLILKKNETIFDFDCVKKLVSEKNSFSEPNNIPFWDFVAFSG